MKPFQKQFVECNDQGFNSNTVFISFEEHPELLPLCPEKSKRMLEKITGVKLLVCSRYGGICSSSNQECLEDRERS